MTVAVYTWIDIGCTGSIHSPEFQTQHTEYVKNTVSKHGFGVDIWAVPQENINYLLTVCSSFEFHVFWYAHLILPPG